MLNPKEITSMVEENMSAQKVRLASYIESLVSDYIATEQGSFEWTVRKEINISFHSEEIDNLGLCNGLGDWSKAKKRSTLCHLVEEEFRKDGWRADIKSVDLPDMKIIIVHLSPRKRKDPPSGKKVGGILPFIVGNNK
jgi:hypothetical protein